MGREEQVLDRAIRSLELGREVRFPLTQTTQLRNVKLCFECLTGCFLDVTIDKETWEYIVRRSKEKTRKRW